MMIRAEQLQADDFSEAQRALLKRRAAHAVHIGVLGCGISAYFENDGSAAQLRARYRCLSCDGGTLEAHIACDDRGITHFLRDGEAYVWPYGRLSEKGTAFLADAVITDALLRAIPASVTLHAAALRYGDAAFAVTGISTAGKTTTAIACAAAGCAIYSDERCIITPAGVVAYPRTLNIRPGALELLRANLPPGDVGDRIRGYRGIQWRDASFEELSGTREHPAPARLRALFSICGYGAAPQTRRVTPIEMLNAAQIGAKSRARGMERVGALIQILSETACFELVLGTPYATALHIQRLLERLPP